MKTKHNTQRYFIIAVVVLFAIVLGLIWFKQSHRSIPHKPLPTVMVKTVKSSIYQHSIQALGQTTAVEGVLLKASASGPITKVNVQSAANVQKGEVLLEINPDQTRAKLLAIEAQIKLDKANLTRYQDLYKRSATSKQSLDQAQTTYDKDIASKQEMMAILNNEVIRAPFSGQAGIVALKVGQYVNMGQTLMSLQDISKLYVDFSIPSKNQNNVKVGQKVEMTLNSDDQKIFYGTVESINNIVDGDSDSVLIRSYFDNKDKQLLPGDLVNIKLYTGKPETVIILPTEAIVYNTDQSFIYTVDQNDIAHKHIVKLGNQVGENSLVILSGVKDGDEVVFEGGSKLHDGEKIIRSKITD